MRTSGAWYLALLLLAPIAYSLVEVVVGTDRLLATIPAPVVVMYVMTALAVVAWIAYRPVARWDGWTRGWLMIGVALWLYTTVVWSSQGVAVPAAAVLLPATFLLILLKRPRPGDVWDAGDAIAWVATGCAFLVLALEVGGVIPSWYVGIGQVGRDLLPFDLTHYWLPLREVLGLDGRWGGYAGYPNIQGQAGALLLVYGFARPGVRRAVFVAVGALTLLLTDSRTSYAAAAAGLVLLAVLPGWQGVARRWTPARVVALVLGVAMALRVAVKVVEDPNLTGRIAVWPEFLSLWSRNPILGAGEQVIDEAVDAGSLPGWADQGHNILIDTFVRYGVLGLVIALAFLGIGALVCVRGARLGQGLSLALVAALLVSCMGDLGLVWPYPTEGMSMLILGVLLARRREDVPGPVAELDESGLR